MGPQRMYGLTTWVRRLLVANLLVFLIQKTLFVDSTFIKAFAFSPLLAWKQPWTFVTYMFLHAGIVHLAFNMLMLFFFGPSVEEPWRSPGIGRTIPSSFSRCPTPCRRSGWSHSSSASISSWRSSVSATALRTRPTSAALRQLSSISRDDSGMRCAASDAVAKCRNRACWCHNRRGSAAAAACRRARPKEGHGATPIRAPRLRSIACSTRSAPAVSRV